MDNSYYRPISKRSTDIMWWKALRFCRRFASSKPVAILQRMSERRLLRIVLTLCIVFPVACLLWACSRRGDVEIRIQDGVPCFTLAESEFRKAKGVMLYNGYVVYDSIQGKEIWGYRLEKAIPLSKNACFDYGKLPAGAVLERNSGALDAPELELNNEYYVQVFAGGSEPEPSNPTFGNFAKFCLQKDISGTLIVEKIRGSCNDVVIDN